MMSGSYQTIVEKGSSNKKMIVYHRIIYFNFVRINSHRGKIINKCNKPAKYAKRNYFTYHIIPYHLRKY